MRAAVEAFFVWLAAAILKIGYPGIVLLMAIESSLVPFPSELVMPPAGYQISQGNMTWTQVLLAGMAGSLAGAYFNYFLAVYLGRPFLLRYGKYFFVPRHRLEQCDSFFARHGEITTFVGRLIPVIRQLISLPAGLARMGLLKFTFYTALGAGIWITVLTYIGFVVGKNQELLRRYMTDATLWTLAGAGLLIFVYVMVYKHRARRRRGIAEE